MDHSFSPNSKRTVNPADLHNDTFSAFNFDSFCNPPETSTLAELVNVDSAVDLTSFQDAWSAQVKMEPLDGMGQMDDFFNLGESSQTSNTPSPSTDMIFSNANSPGDFVRDHSQTSSPETTNDQDAKPPTADDAWNSLYAAPDVIHIPQPIDPPIVYLQPDKTKTRAETQIKVMLTMDPLDERFEFIHFPRKTLAKPKLLASAEEKAEAESKGEALHMDMFLVCATAVDKKPGMDQAMRRAAGKEPTPRRPAGVALTELDKEDPAHPQNGGEVLICEGCKERERKRYDRKKKRAEDEEEWTRYDDERIIMINEKEYKKWKDVDSSELNLSSRAKQLDFAMRIACYCRHQEEKSPVGYRVIFTFNDSAGNMVVQHVSEVFQITDDHKNKELPAELPRPLTIPQYMPAQYPQASGVVPIYQYPVEGQYPTALGPYSQPPTPVMSTFQSPMSPMDSQFPQNTTPTAPPPRQSAPTFSGAAAAAAAPQYARQQHNYYDAPMMSPTTQVSPESQYLPRPVSMDNFNYTSDIHYPGHQGFASAPPSAVSTPINLSRPASPTWEQGPKKKTLRCVYFYVDEE